MSVQLLRLFLVSQLSIDAQDPSFRMRTEELTRLPNAESVLRATPWWSRALTACNPVGWFK